MVDHSGGSREFVNWSAPLGVTRENPASARVLGPGACDSRGGGSIGYARTCGHKQALSFRLRLFRKGNHRGIDSQDEGEAFTLLTRAVVVYSGWNNYGTAI